MSELSNRARDLIAMVEESDGPTTVEKARLRAAVLWRVGVGVAVGSAVTSTALGSKAAVTQAAVTNAVVANAAGSNAGLASGAAATSAIAKGSLLAVAVKGLAVVALVGAIVGAIVRVGAPAHVALSPPRAIEPVPALALRVSPPASTGLSSGPVPREGTLPSEPPPKALPVAPRPAPLGPEHSPEPRLVPIVAPLPPPLADSVDAETTGLAAVLDALRDGRPGQAILLLDEQDTRYPTGALGEERAATRIDSLCALGRVSEARTAAVRFLAQGPRSLLAPRIRASCGVVTAQ